MKRQLRTALIIAFFLQIVSIANAQYCTVSPTPDCNGTVYISNVTLGNINRTSACDGYVNTGLHANLITGSTDTIYVTIVNAGVSPSSQLRIFIDYNRDSDFCDLGELIHNEWDQIPGSYSESFTFMVPSNATPGVARMRLMLDSAGGSSRTYGACGGAACNGNVAFSGRGEVEDYYIDLRSPIVPDCALPSYPVNNSSNIPRDTILSWVDNGGAGGTDGYRLYFGTNTPPDNIINGVDLGNDTSYSFDTLHLQLNTKYYWQIVPYNSIGSATGCSISNFTTPTGVGIHSFTSSSFHYSVNPNPFDNTINLSFTSATEDVKIELMNITGSLLYADIIKPGKSISNIISIPSESYPDGVYLCRLATGNEVETLKIIKIPK